MSIFQHQRSKACLDKVMVGSQGIANAEFLHGYERRAIDETPRLVRTVLEEIHSARKKFARSRQGLIPWIIAVKQFPRSNGIRPCPRFRENRTDFQQYGVGCPHLATRSDGGPQLVYDGMILVPPIEQGDHITRIDKQSVNLVDHEIAWEFRTSSDRVPLPSPRGLRPNRVPPGSLQNN